MSQPLTVRNLTAATIYLNCIETFEDLNLPQSRASTFTFASGNTTSTTPCSPQLGRHAQSFDQRYIKIELRPFESYTLGAQGNNPDEEIQSSILLTKTLRLTVEILGGERYRIDTNPMYTQKAAQSVIPLTPNPATVLGALFHPAKPASHLTIHTSHSHDLSKWMSYLPSTLPLSALSIPGTHNSHAHYRALPSVRCQVVPVQSQLENGIRFLDIRVQPSHATDASKKDLYLVHGAFPISLTGTKYLEPILETCYEFLAQNPGETILISLKREGVGNSTDELLSQILERHYVSPNRSRWYTGDKIPYLGDVRGKLILVRRYMLDDKVKRQSEDGNGDSDSGYGLDATEWPYNSTHAIHGPFCVQDFCEVLHPSSITDKLKYSNEHLVRSAQCTAFIPGVNTDVKNPVPSGPLYLNFLSGSNFWRIGCWPGSIAKVVNRGIEEWICMGHHLDRPIDTPAEPGKMKDGGGGENGLGNVVRKANQGDGCTGVVVMDCVGEGGDWDLVKLIVGMNMGVAMKAEAR
ncbi:1-phosphatidylinositol phosphodiesterase precursor [Lojkania enalia]|uniref:1-phosphatidylinositol phosphodiesterase n=1 Tax=Lojkania enalia TaxID=147567 RepID=A0A9P4N5D8_9PLEO|nr:1-phosphatidylinositol phosphodiesterase precursor [Didymosphaeria enalia]